MLCIYSVDTESQAAALVDSLAARQETPCAVFVQDYCLTLPWRRRLEEIFTRRSVQSGGGHLRWLNKLEALSDTPFAETIFLDCDMVVMKDIGYWWEALATDDLTFWNFRRRPEDIGPDAMVTNQLNPHPFCAHYNVEAVPIMLGGGHYYFRNTPRGQAVLQRIADIMIEAEENPDALYWKFAGPGNIVGDEPAASMAVVEMGIILPEPSPLAPCPPVGCFMHPWQRWVNTTDLAHKAPYWCEWTHIEMEPEVIHFAGGGKQDLLYRAWREAKRVRWERLPASAPDLPVSPPDDERREELFPQRGLVTSMGR